MRTESTLSTNDFNKPKVLKEYDAIYTLLVRLILLEPRSIPDEPEMGVGLVSKYRYCNETDIQDIQQAISEQISKYLPEYQSVDVKVYLNNKILNIQISIDGVLFNLNMDTSSPSGGIKLSSLMDNN